MTKSAVEGTCVARMETTSKKYAPMGVTGKDQGVVIIAHEAKLAAGVVGGPREENFDVLIFQDRSDAMLASERMQTARSDAELASMIARMPTWFVTQTFKGVSRGELQKVAPIRELCKLWPADCVAGGIVHSTVGRAAILDLCVMDTDDCMKICSVESLCVGVTLNGTGSARIQYERAGTIKAVNVELQLATKMFDSFIEVNEEGPRVGIQLYCPNIALLLSNLPRNRSETHEMCNTDVGSIADLFYHTPRASPNAEFRECLPWAAGKLTFDEISSLGVEMALSGERILQDAIRHKIPIPTLAETDTSVKLHAGFAVLVDAVLAAKMAECRPGPGATVDGPIEVGQAGAAPIAHWSASCVQPMVQTWRAARQPGVYSRMDYTEQTATIRAAPQGPLAGPLAGAAGAMPAPFQSAQAMQPVVQHQMQAVTQRKQAVHEHAAALRAITASHAEWMKFLGDSLILTDAQNVVRHPLMIQSGEYVLSGQLERWFKSMPERLVAPAVIGTFAQDQTAASLFDFVIDTMQQAADNAQQGTSGTQPSVAVGAWGNSGNRMMPAATSVGTETERREATTMQADGIACMEDPNVERALKEIIAKMDANDNVGAEAMVRAAIGIEGKLQRLLTMGDDDVCKAALSGHTLPMFDLAITRIRSMLQRRLEELLSTKNTQPSERFSKAVAAVRCGKMCKLRLPWLLDMEDSQWSKDKPLASFGENASRGTALGNFGHAMSKLSQVWTFADPVNTVGIHGFINAVTDCVFRGDEAGVPWSSKDASVPTLSSFWASLMRKCDSTQDGCMLGGRAVARSAPSKEWCTDTSLEWVRQFDSGCAAAAAQRAATAATKRLLDEAKAASKAHKADSAPAKRQATQEPADAPKTASKPKTRTKAAAKNMGSGAGGTPAVQPTATAVKVEPAAPADDRGGAAGRAELLRVHGTKLVDGVTRQPCFFFFTKGHCNYSEEKCRCHHG